MRLLQLPKLPAPGDSFPEVVRILDKIRLHVSDEDRSDFFSEFCWFIREYPRIYRYHLDCAEYRLRSIYRVFSEANAYFEKELEKTGGTSYEMGYCDITTTSIYWDFESFLSAINTALDILARIVGTAFMEPTPISFNRLCKKHLGGIADDFEKANSVWVSRLKDYRDCFTHFTSVDTLLGITARKYRDGFEIRAKLPKNPNMRDILLFKYSRRPELLRYAISTYRHMVAFDKLVAKRIEDLYENGDYPLKTTGLFFLGRREREAN